MSVPPQAHFGFDFIADSTCVILTDRESLVHLTPAKGFLECHASLEELDCEDLSSVTKLRTFFSSTTNRGGILR